MFIERCPLCDGEIVTMHTQNDLWFIGCDGASSCPNFVCKQGDGFYNEKRAWEEWRYKNGR